MWTTNSRTRGQRFPDSDDVGVRLTDGRCQQIKKRSVPCDDKEYLADAPIPSPGLLDLTIEEDQPVVYLIIGGRTRGASDVGVTLLSLQRVGTDGLPGVSTWQLVE